MRRKLFFTYIIIIILLAGFLGGYAINIASKYYTEEYEEHLTREVEMLSFILAEKYQEAGREGWFETAAYYAEKLNSRITLVDQAGTVLYDSAVDKQEELENHKNREEILEAKKGKIGISTRLSLSTGISYIYAAYSLKTIDGEFILRIAVPLLALTTMKNQVILSIFCGIFVVCILAFFCAYFFAGNIVKPLNQLTGAVEDIAKGNYGKEIAPIASDQVGQLTRAFNFMSRELNSTITQLEEENVKMELIVDSMVNGVVAVDAENKILFMNTVCRQLFHIKLQEIAGYRFQDIISQKELGSMVEKVRKERKSISGELVYQSGLGKERILRVNVAPIAKADYSDTNIGVLIVFQDVTQIRKLEKLRSDFVSNVTHELKTPLTSILGFTDTLKNGAITDPDTAKRFIEIIEIEAKRLYRLIQDILSLSEIETRREDINLAPYDMTTILNSVLELLKPAIAEKGLALQVQEAEELPLFICNSDRMMQMMINLIENAVKYTEKGSISIRLWAENQKLCFMVRDTGIGIPEESKQRIFERFYRVDKSRSRKAGGTGLGLSIVKHIVLLYEGEIEVESTIDQGSQFTIFLPYLQSKQQKTQKEQESGC